VVPTVIDPTHRLFRVILPQAGQWEVQVGCSGGEFCGGQYLVEAAVKSRLSLHLYLPKSLPERIVGADMPILAHLTDTAAVLGANVQATITIPEERGALVVFPPETRTLVLYDDGRHGDGSPNDGLYGNVLHRTQRAGSYAVIVTAIGSAPAHGAFTRRDRAAFYLSPNTDSDGDGMPDEWERRFGLNPSSQDGSEDLDLDGLINLQEYRNGTDPRNSDSDGGGENDGSEVAHGSDPGERADDGVAPLWGVSVAQAPHVSFDPVNTPFTNTVPLQFNLNADHVQLTLYRSTIADSGYQILADNLAATNIFFDYHVQVGQRYFYKAQAKSSDGRQSAVIGPVEAIARAEWSAPDGILLINNDAQVATNRDVTLSISTEEDVTEMRIANNSAFEGAAWQPFQSALSWRLPDGLSLESTATIYAQFRDAAGNEGIIVHSNIRWNPSGCSPRLRIRLTRIYEWDCGVLQAADHPDGPYVDVPGATSPYTTGTGSGRRYFRVRLP